MPRKIPLAGAELRGHIGVSRRQILGQVLGFGANLKPHGGKNQHGPPFSKSNIVLSINLLSNLLAYWKLDSAIGIRTFDVNGNNALVNASLQTFPAAKILNGCRIGPTSFINEEVFNVNFNTTTEFTVSAWIKFNVLPTAGGSVPSLFKKLCTTTETSGFALFVNNGSLVISFNVGKNGSFHTCAPAGIVSAAVWYFFVGKHEISGVSTLYWFNESSLLSQTSASGIYGPGIDADTGKFQLHDNVNATMDITYDEVGYWSKALNTNEINILWNNGIGKSYPFT